MNPTPPLIPPNIRQWLYTLAALGTAIIPLLVAYRVLDGTAAQAWMGVVAALGSLGTVGATTAAVVTSKQRKEGLYNATTPAEAAVSAIQATVSRAGSAQADLQQVIQAVTEALAPLQHSAPPERPAATVTSWVAPLPPLPPLVSDLLEAVKR